MIVSGRIVVDVNFPALAARVPTVTGLAAEIGIKIRNNQKKASFLCDRGTKKGAAISQLLFGKLEFICRSRIYDLYRNVVLRFG